MYETPPSGAIRNLLRSAFTPIDLHRFCQDMLQPKDLFKELRYRFGPNDNIDIMKASSQKSGRP